MKETPRTPCVFFDRDGIVNHPPDDTRRYVLREEEFHLLPGFTDALRVVLQKGYKAVIVTNQSGVSKGRMTQADLDRIHAKLHALLEAEGLALHDVIECTSGDDAHPNRKPNPGMLLDAARKHHLDLARMRDDFWAEQPNDPRRRRRLAAALLMPIPSASGDSLVKLVCRADDSAADEILTALAKGGTE